MVEKIISSGKVTTSMTDPSPGSPFTCSAHCVALFAYKSSAAGERLCANIARPFAAWKSTK